MNTLRVFLLSLSLTIAVELPLAYLFSVRKKGLAVVFLVNILTNPAAVLICLAAREFLPENLYIPAQIITEILVVIAEALIYGIAKKREIINARSWVMSAVLNTVSYLSGILINLVLAAG